MIVPFGYESGSNRIFVDSTSYPNIDTVSLYAPLAGQSPSTAMTVAGK